MKKSIGIVYNKYEIILGNVSPYILKYEEVSFSKENIEYEDKLSYEENVQSFVLACIDNKVVRLDHGVYIPLHNIHGFYPIEQKQMEHNISHSQNHGSWKPKDGKDGNFRKFEKHKKIKYKSHRPSRTPSSTSLPFEIEKTDNNEAKPVDSSSNTNVSDDSDPVPF